MALKLITPPVGEPISVSNVKLKLGIAIADVASDIQIGWMIPAARRWVEQRINRALITQTWALYLDAFPAVITLPMGNVQSVTHIKYTDQGGTLTTITGYQQDLVSIPARLAPAYGGSWPVARSTFNAVEVQFVAGYGLAVDVPPDIIEVLYRIVGHWLNHQAALENGTTITRVPYAVEQMLWPYLDYNYEPNA
ncbi:MAG: hypothetical protein K6U74_00060 [Firmicutes bacterium]|nr:hypothetical protein [Bacillota bacterium]